MTAVEWLINEIDMQYPHINIRWKQIMIEQALEMEKQEIMDAYLQKRKLSNISKSMQLCIDAEKYYNKTYKK
jgi:hypothetical protein